MVEEEEENRQSNDTEYSVNVTHLTYVDISKADTNDYASTGIQICHNNTCDTHCDKGHWHFLTTIYLITNYPCSRRETSNVKTYFLKPI
jgi:hypothetical protein